MRNKKELNLINKAILGAINKTVKNFIFNFRPYKLKGLYKSKYEKWVYIGSIPISFIALREIPLVMHTINYFFAKSILQTSIQTYYLMRYSHISTLFNKNVAIVSVKRDKKDKDITFTFNSFVSLKEIIQKRDLLEQYFNTNIIEIEQHKYNKRLIKIITNKYKSFDLSNKATLENKLISILRYYFGTAKLIDIKHLDFYTEIKVSMLEDIKNVMSRKEDIAFKLKKSIDIDLGDNCYIFKIKNKKMPIFNFEDYLNKVKLDNKKLPVVLGLDHKTGKVITADIANLLHTFVNGLTGSGKSCIFNSIIQSLMYWNSQNVSFVMVDFKIIEFKQYEEFSNVTYITTLDKFNNILDKIIDLMLSRYKSFGAIKNIEDYNHKKNIKMPYLVLCIDECSFISSHKNSGDIWDKLIQIVQMGRACGIIVLSATQCPDHSQVNTTFRRQIDTKICGRLRTNRDLEVVGIYSNDDISKYGVGEFVIDGKGFDNTKIQGLFIDEKKNKNKVYDGLNKALNKQNKDMEV